MTEQGARAAASHTASMTGSYDFYRAMFKQTGIVEIREIHETVDYVKAFEAEKFPAGNGVAVMGVSGGSAIVFADAGEPEGLKLCDLNTQTQERLAQVVPNIGAVHNPIDLTAGYFSAGNESKLEAAVRATLDDSGVHAVCVNLATTGNAGSLVAADVLSRIASTTSKPVVVFSSTPASITEAALRVFASAKIRSFHRPLGLQKQSQCWPNTVPAVTIEAGKLCAVSTGRRYAVSQSGLRNIVGGRIQEDSRGSRYSRDAGPYRERIE